MYSKRTFQENQFVLYNISTQGYTAPVQPSLKNVQYKCQIINNVLNTTIHQTYANQQTEFSNVQYLFPLEDGICLESFEARYNDKVIKGIVKEKEEAKNIYDKNKQEGNLVTYAATEKTLEGQSLEIKIGNIPPLVDIDIIISYSEQLNCVFNKYYFVNIPLQCVQDEISVKMGKDLLLVDLFCTSRITYLYSSEKSAIKNMIDDNTAQIKLQQVNQSNKRVDLQLYFSYEGMFQPQVIYGSSKVFHEDSVKRSVIPPRNSIMVSFVPNFNQQFAKELDDTVRAALMNGEDILDDNFRLKINQQIVDHTESSKCEFIFLLDRSGSMQGSKIQKAIEALKLFLRSLPNNSYFNVISFGSNYDLISEESLKYTPENLELAIGKINHYSANMGGTDILDPLVFLFQVAKKIDGYNRQVYLLTDGEVGNSEQVIQLIKNNNLSCKVNSIGFGKDVDQKLIQQSAIAGKGIYKFILPEQDVTNHILEMLLSSLTPSLDSFSIKYDKDIFESYYPSPNDILCIFKDDIFNLHLFFKTMVEINLLTEAQKTITISYYDSSLKQFIEKKLILQMQDTFAFNKKLQETVFKIGKQLSLNHSFSQKDNNSALIQEAVDFQLVTEKTAIICLIETLRDEKRIIYENIPHNKRENVGEDYNPFRNHIEHLQMQLNQLPQNDINYQNNLQQLQVLENQQQHFYQQLMYQRYQQQQQLDNEDCRIKRSMRSCSTGLDDEQLRMIAQHETEVIMQSGEILKASIEIILNIFNSEGIWKYNINVVEKLFKRDTKVLPQIIELFLNQDAFMTFLIIYILDKNFNDQKTKWLLISKKATKYVNNNIKPGVRIDKIKQLFELLIHS